MLTLTMNHYAQLFDIWTAVVIANLIFFPSTWSQLLFCNFYFLYILSFRFFILVSIYLFPFYFYFHISNYIFTFISIYLIPFHFYFIFLFLYSFNYISISFFTFIFYFYFYSISLFIFLLQLDILHNNFVHLLLLLFFFCVKVRGYSKRYITYHQSQVNIHDNIKYQQPISFFNPIYKPI